MPQHKCVLWPPCDWTQWKGQSGSPLVEVAHICDVLMSNVCRIWLRHFSTSARTSRATTNTSSFQRQCYLPNWGVTSDSWEIIIWATSVKFCINRQNKFSTYNIFKNELSTLKRPWREPISQKLGISIFDVIILLNDVLIDTFYCETRTTPGSDSEPVKSSPLHKVCINHKVVTVRPASSSFD